MNIEFIIGFLNDWIIGWPLMIYVMAISIVYTVALGAIQFRYFFTAFKATLFPSKKFVQGSGEMSPFHAFVTTINSNLGNGSIAGVATAIFIGGPGAAFWLVIFGFILMAPRFAEVYISTLYGSREKTTTGGLGGPMLYLRDVFGGKFVVYAYAACCFVYGLIGGNLIQANSIQTSITATWGIAPMISAVGLLVFVLYILLGGADRIVKISLALVPIKVTVFVISSFTVLAYHYDQLWSALVLMVKSGCSLYAIGGGVIGFSLQQMIRAGMTRSIYATESGLGSAAIMFGSTGNDDAIQNGLMGMVSTFISTLVCFIVALCIVVSGVSSSGLNGTPLTIAAFETTFGWFGGWIVSFLSVTFGFGVLLSYAYVVRSVWMFLTNNRFLHLFTILYTCCAFVGALAPIELVWDLGTIFMGFMLLIHLYGLLMLLPKIRKDLMLQLRDYKA